MKINKTPRREEHREHATGGVCYPGRSRARARACVCVCVFLCSDEGAKIYITLTRPAPWPVKREKRNESFCAYKHKRADRECVCVCEWERAGASTHATYPGQQRERRKRVLYIIMYYTKIFSVFIRWTRMAGGRAPENERSVKTWMGRVNDERYNIVYI